METPISSNYQKYQIISLLQAFTYTNMFLCLCCHNTLHQFSICMTSYFPLTLHLPTTLRQLHSFSFHFLPLKNLRASTLSHLHTLPYIHHSLRIHTFLHRKKIGFGTLIFIGFINESILSRLCPHTKRICAYGVSSNLL
jgi:hypothetical protein